jgi:tetratricopeptide (TPR) repeat protein
MRPRPALGYARIGLRFALALMLVMSSSGIASAEPMRPETRALYARGMELYNAGRYAEAAIELRAGQAIEPRPEFLYALGQAERNLKNCARAIDYYRAFLATSPPPDQRQLAVVQLERCEQELAARAAEPPPAAPPSETKIAAPAPAAPAVDAGRKPWYRDPAGGALTGVGLAGVIAGAVLVAHSTVLIGGAHDSYGQYLDARGVRGEQIGGIVTLSAGGLLMLGGVIRYATRRR